jgi:hypothetical protein
MKLYKFLKATLMIFFLYSKQLLEYNQFFYLQNDKMKGIVKIRTTNEARKPR